MILCFSSDGLHGKKSGMPRKARIDASGALHHIIIRGIERRSIFRDDADRENFLIRLALIFDPSRTACYAWALMPNHVHLLLRTGDVPIASVMQKLLTGYAVSFNLRHRRHGQLFQNRYKSILCQEDAYLKELVRYIHLNPLRAGLVKDMEALSRYPWSGHGALSGGDRHIWQDADYVLRAFGEKTKAARRRYLEFVSAGAEMGRRPELTGGGLIRSMGGWQEVKGLRRTGIRSKGDERILGDSDFVEDVLGAAQDRLNRREALRAQGYTFEQVLAKAGEACGLDPSEVLKPVKRPKVVKARRLLCYWAVRELGLSATDVARRLQLTQPAVSRAAAAGEAIAAESRARLGLDTRIE
jgi:REP element-mobilizing transposase RayT